MSDISFSDMAAAGRVDDPRPGWRGPDETPSEAYVAEHIERARVRLAELRERYGDDDGLDAEVDENLQKWIILAPPGWVYQWKLFSVWNKEYPNYMANLFRRGWAAVPADRHRTKLYPGYKEENIVQEGLMLMERPIELERRARLREERKALDQIRVSELKLSVAPPDTAPRDRNPRTRPVVRGHVGPAIPE